jgi:hypothetical protein
MFCVVAAGAACGLAGDCWDSQECWPWCACLCGQVLRCMYWSAAAASSAQCAATWRRCSFVIKRAARPSPGNSCRSSAWRSWQERGCVSRSHNTIACTKGGVCWMWCMLAVAWQALEEVPCISLLAAGMHGLGPTETTQSLCKSLA